MEEYYYQRIILNWIILSMNYVYFPHGTHDDMLYSIELALKLTIIEPSRPFHPYLMGSFY
jgi:hypothetical protein